MDKAGLIKIETESDVEQKFIVPLLLQKTPLGLGYQISDFRTKADLRKVVIGKGTSSKVYYPDYVIIKAGLPLVVIEAKKPGEDLIEALREARLYATELNAKFESGLNPCQKVVATDSRKIVCGMWDSDELLMELVESNFNPSDVKFSQFVDLISNEVISKFALGLSQKVRGNTQFKKPTRLLGGRTVQGEEMVPNSFGTTIALEYRSLFNPETREERAQIVQNAYVPSQRRLKHVDPIEKIIRGINPPSITNTTQLEDTGIPTELIDTLSKPKNLHGQLLLLVGNVGAGKSTFTDYLRDVALPEDIKKSTIWLYLDLNKAPLSKELIYGWIKSSLIERFRFEFRNEYDFDDYEVLIKLFSVEVNRFKKTFGPLYTVGSEKYNEKLAEILQSHISNSDSYLNAFVRYLCAEKNRLLIVVFDNCDKRKRDDQLLMFDVANWLREQLKCLIFLPIRNTTYDHHRKEPPLDTVIKDLVFRIEPPIFSTVLYKRIEYALRTMSIKQKKLEFELPNGMKVEYPQSDQGYYLACILKSLFQNVFFNRVITALTDRDIRRGLEIFLDFCKSGHITEDEIFRIKQSRGNYTLQNHIISRVLIRGNRRYYNDVSVIKNLFNSYPEDSYPNPFTRLAILRWLKNRYRVHGPNKTKGYHKILTLIQDLNSLGFNENNIVKELSTLIKVNCIVTESQELDVVDNEDLICITSSGIIHLDVLNNLDYLSSSSEDVWYREAQIADGIAQRISGRKGYGHFTKQTAIDNARDLKDYLLSYQTGRISKPEVYLKDEKVEDLIQIDLMGDLINRMIEKDDHYVDVKGLIAQYPIGKIVDAQIASIQDYGIFVEFGLNATGFAHISTFSDKRESRNILLDNYEDGQEVIIEIISFNEDHNRFHVKILDET